ncbi:hypothetical protein LOK49_LG12G01822 [Camellia lanceoleosa]|uniref:Uncharacterized protein n=1 Tax=Camellia lanceoleosa TaxID=1840588 RepID=A0ACC0FTN2_9ERIC|nr:hypothetical protein LOK49_LG12G01822 [Camellia lanceoleosa]
MRFVVLALLLMMVSSSLAANRKALTMIEMHKQDHRELAEFESKFEYPGSSVDNHHYIPREDFNNYNGGGGSGSGTGTPQGGGKGKLNSIQMDALKETLVQRREKFLGAMLSWKTRERNKCGS